MEELHFVGLAADVCVNFSIRDALKEGFEVVLIEDATRALDEEDYEEAKKVWKEKGVKVMQSVEL